VKILAAAFGAFVVLSAIACGGGSPATTSPTGATSMSSALNLAGTWNGSGSDAHGPELMTWSLTQSGAAISGTADMRPVDPSDGTCGSCHKYKKGTVAGTADASGATLTIHFPSGGDVPTPMCDISFRISAAGSIVTRIGSTYTGDDSCEGPINDGTLTMDRKR
jgi:hypothetical protein